MISCNFTCERYDLYFHCSELQLFLTVLGLMRVLVKTLRIEHFKTCQTKTGDVKLKQMASLIGLALCHFARDVKLTAAASGFLKSPVLFHSFFKK